MPLEQERFVAQETLKSIRIHGGEREYWNSIVELPFTSGLPFDLVIDKVISSFEGSMTKEAILYLKIYLAYLYQNKQMNHYKVSGGNKAYEEKKEERQKRNKEILYKLILTGEFDTI